jgi:serine/threonine-protein kinase
VSLPDGPGDRDLGDLALARECFRCQRLLATSSTSCPQCARPTTAARLPYVLEGRFRLVRRLRSGGLGIVYQAIDLVLDRPVALKTLLEPTPQRAASLRREARMLATADHPHLARVHDLLFFADGPVLVMELLEGTLEHCVEEGVALPAPMVVDIGAKVGDALAYLHRRGLVHGDVKPANIGLAADGSPKLLDFGLTRHARDLAPPTPASAPFPAPPTSVYDDARGSIGYVVGTLNYLSPEALSGRPAQPSDDLWALAVVLWEAAHGRRLFNGATQATIARRILRARIPRTRLEQGAAAALASFLSAALADDPGQRFPTAETLVEMLLGHRR